MAENNSGEKIEKKLKNKMLEDISINSKQPMAEISNQIYMRNIDLEKFSKIKKQFNQSIKNQHIYNIGMAENNSGEKIEKKLKNKNA